MFLKSEPTIYQDSMLAEVCGEAFDRFISLVRAEGLEPPRLASQVPKTCVSTSSTTPAVREAAAGEGAQLYPFGHLCQSHCGRAVRVLSNQPAGAPDHPLSRALIADEVATFPWVRYPSWLVSILPRSYR